jgi:hypothetical protein
MDGTDGWAEQEKKKAIKNKGDALFWPRHACNVGMGWDEMDKWMTKSSK